MRTKNQKDISLAFVGKDVTGALGSIDALVDGEVGIFTPGGARISSGSLSAVDAFKIGVRYAANELILSETIKTANILSAVKTPFVADTDQEDYIGYNGSSGAIVVNSDTVYRASFMIKETIAQNHGGVYVKDMTYKSDATATQAEIAEGLVKSGLLNLSREAEKPMKIELVSDDTVTVLVPTINVTEGSEFVSFSTAHGLSIGDFIGIAGFFYKIESIPTTTTAKLSFPYQGATASSVTVTIANSPSTANFGIKLTGKTLSFKTGKLNYKKSRWAVALDAASFGTTPLTKSSTATLGNGNFEQVAELEWFTRGNQGEFFRMGEPNIFEQTFNAVPGTNYDLWTLSVNDENKSSSLIAIQNPKQFIVAIPTANPNWASDANAGVDTLFGTL